MEKRIREIQRHPMTDRLSLGMGKYNKYFENCNSCEYF